MSEVIKQLDSRFVTDRDVRVTRALVSLDEYSQLKQHITELEQQLKTAKQDAVRIFANQQADLIANIDGVSTRDAAIHKGISIALLARSQCYIKMLDEEYANNL